MHVTFSLKTLAKIDRHQTIQYEFQQQKPTENVYILSYKFQLGITLQKYFVFTFFSRLFLIAYVKIVKNFLPQTQNT